MTSIMKIYYSDRLNHTYLIYSYETIDMNTLIEQFIMNYYNKSIKDKKITYELFNKIINDHEIRINNIIITDDNKKSTIRDLFDIPVLQIIILLHTKIIRDIEGNNIMTNLLKYISHDEDSYNIISELSYNVGNIDSSVDKLILKKNILQQTQYIHLPDEKMYKNINIILYDMVFFNTGENINQEQIYNLIELDEIAITEFLINPDKIKKFIKPAGKNIIYNKHYNNKFVSEIYARELDKILSKYKDIQITWYIVNYKNITEQDKISYILEQINISKDLIHVYGFSG